MANGNGNGLTATFTKNLFGIVQALLTLLIIGVGTLLLNQKTEIAEIKIQLTAVQRTIDNLEIPPPWVRDRLISIEGRLERHIETDRLGKGGL